ncbi:MAG: MSMEG_1061 family FMN-dependent PPOX-type flavoprotein, partial [Gammaproteobacteria bacterium]
MSDIPVSDVINDKNELRKHFGNPNEIAVACIKSSIDSYHQQFIEHSPLACLASCGSDGQPTISPKGDAPGFVHVIDANTLAIPDRPGNNKLESFHNIIENPKVALIFFIPGIRESLRVSGEAQIVRDPDILKVVQAGRTLPAAAMVIKVTKIYFHCGKALIRSKLWRQESQ